MAGSPAAAIAVAGNAGGGRYAAGGRYAGGGRYAAGGTAAVTGMAAGIAVTGMVCRGRCRRRRRRRSNCHALRVLPLRSVLLIVEPIRNSSTADLGSVLRFACAQAGHGDLWSAYPADCFAGPPGINVARYARSAHLVPGNLLEKVARVVRIAIRCCTRGHARSARCVSFKTPISGFKTDVRNSLNYANCDGSRASRRFLFCNTSSA